MDTSVNTVRPAVTTTAQTQPLLAVRDLNRTFGTGKDVVTAVKNVSF